LINFELNILQAFQKFINNNASMTPELLARYCHAVLKDKKMQDAELEQNLNKVVSRLFDSIFSTLVFRFHHYYYYYYTGIASTPF